MILVGLTGGIGAGKSTVSGLLAERGAVIVDADAVTREVQAPGAPLLGDLAAEFGASIIAADGSLDRPALAAIAFADPEKLKRLNEIVHPAVGREINRRVLAHRDGDRVVVMDIPLLTENPREGLQAIIVVDVPVETQVARLVASRGFDEADARARIGRQATREQRLATATHVIDNSGAPAKLVKQVDRVWAAITGLPQLDRDAVLPARRDAVEAVDTLAQRRVPIPRRRRYPVQPIGTVRRTLAELPTIHHDRK